MVKEPSRKKKIQFLKREYPVDIANDDEIRSLILSHMKRLLTLDVSTDGQLKVKRRTIIHRGQSSNQRAQEDDEEEMVQGVYHITVEEANVDEVSKEDIKEAPPQLED
ncbi:hypothetical protein ACFX2C_043181 [Malus domestica]